VVGVRVTLGVGRFGKGLGVGGKGRCVVGGKFEEVGWRGLKDAGKLGLGGRAGRLLGVSGAGVELALRKGGGAYTGLLGGADKGAEPGSVGGTNKGGAGPRPGEGLTTPTVGGGSVESVGGGEAGVVGQVRGTD
jgi:hypothetical protein